MWSPAKRIALLTWALGVAAEYVIGVNVVPWIVSGGRPSFDSMRQPIVPSGSITRRMGRRDSDSSPITVVVNGCAASTPDIMRIVVPELPASRGTDGAAKRPSPRPMTVTVVPSSRTLMPSARRQASVEWQSAPGA